LQVLTLEEFLRLFGNRASINVEMKDPDPKVADLLYHQLLQAKLHGRVIVGSRYCEPVIRMREISANSVATSGCETEVLYFTLSHWVGLDSFYQPDSIALQIPVGTGAASFDTTEFLESAKRRSQKVHYWVVNDPDQMQRLLLLGADGIVTDRVDLAMRVFCHLRIKCLNDTTTTNEVTMKQGTRSGNTTTRVVGKMGSEDETPYFIPESSPVEGHTCVSTSCQLTKLVLRPAIIRLFLGSLLISPLLFLCCCSSRRRRRATQINTDR